MRRTSQKRRERIDQAFDEQIAAMREKEQSVEPTPRPWALEYANGNVPFVDIVGGKTDDPLSGMTVARWQFPERRPDELIEQDKANARLIVKAVNAHSGLVEALTELVEQVSIILNSMESGKDDDLESAYQFADAKLEELRKVQA